MGKKHLHGACCNAHAGVVSLLLAAGASTTLEESDGRTAMDRATELQQAAVRHLLLHHMDAGTPCTQLAAVQPSVSLAPNTEPQR